MTIEEMKRRKNELGYSYERIAELSGVPLGTVQKVFCGQTRNPRYDTLSMLEQVFRTRGITLGEDLPLYRVPKQGQYTIEDYRELPDEQRLELIDGYFYDMAAPSMLHQLIAGDVHRQIANYIYDKGGKCQPAISPIDVQLDCDEKTMVQPDVAIMCEETKIKKWGVYGSPDFVMEVLTPSSWRKDCVKKLQKYEAAGVREYWILDMKHKKLIVYFFEAEVGPTIYGLEELVPIKIYNDELKIDFKRISEWIDKEEED